MKIDKLATGTGSTAKTGDTVVVHYTGWLADGTRFDSSIDRNEPFTFLLGHGQVIQGWDQALPGLKVGDKVRLTIPLNSPTATRAIPAPFPLALLSFSKSNSSPSNKRLLS